MFTSVRYSDATVDGHADADKQHRQNADGHEPVQRALQGREARWTIAGAAA